jgi:hypothetical protein
MPAECPPALGPGDGLEGRCVPGKAGESGERQKVVVSYRSYRRQPVPEAKKGVEFH